MSELKKKANPRYKELAELEKRIKEGNGEISELIGELIIEARVHTVLQDRLCTLKESQQESDDAKHDRSTKINLLVLMIAGMAFYKEWIKVDAGIAAAVMGLFQ